MFTAAGFDPYEELSAAMSGLAPFYQEGQWPEFLDSPAVEPALGAAATGPGSGLYYGVPPSPRLASQTRFNERAAAAEAAAAGGVHLCASPRDYIMALTEHDRVAGDEDVHARMEHMAPVYHSLYKTELCRSFEETGTCRYGAKCQFAHGQGELRAVLRHPRYKTELCRTFASSGSCPYGSRCRFIHYRGAASASAAAGGGRQLVVTVPAFPPIGSGPPSPHSPACVQHVSGDGTSSSGSPPASPRSGHGVVMGAGMSDSPSPRSDGTSLWDKSPPSPEVQLCMAPPSPADSVRAHHRLPIFETLVPDDHQQQRDVPVPAPAPHVTPLLSPKRHAPAPAGSPKSQPGSPAHRQPRHHGRAGQQHGGAGRNRSSPRGRA